ncbi:MAG: DNA cytosine methyltransferase [Pirellulaceae bacterium]
MAVVKLRKKIRTFDMFSGGGGSSRGAAIAGATPVAALDKWKLATETYALNFPDAKTYRMQASSLTPQKVKKDVGRIDLLLASPECTSHSVAKGKKPGCEMSRATAFEVIRFAKVLLPKWIVVENVVQMQRWHRFEEWIEKLEDIGYHTKSVVIDAQMHRTPQSRRRLFVIAEFGAEPNLPGEGRQTEKTVQTILGTGESKKRPWRFSRLDDPHRAAATLERADRAIAELGKKTPFVMVYYGTDGAGGFQTLDRPLRTVTTLDRFAFVRPNCRGHEMRMLQPPELAAAMGFPRSHLWAPSTRRERIKLIGNAVCPAVMCDVVSALVGDED